MAFGTQPVGAHTHLWAGRAYNRTTEEEEGEYVRQGGEEERTVSEQVREREKTRKCIFHLGTVRLWLS